MGPRELFYADLYATRETPCRSRLGSPGIRDQHAGCVGAHLVEHDLFDFLLLSLPDNDNHSHKHGPEAQVESIAAADRQLGAGGRRRPARLEAFLDGPRGDRLRRSLPRAGRAPDIALGRLFRLECRGPRTGRPRSRRAGALPQSARRDGLSAQRRAAWRRPGARDRHRASSIEGVDVVAWMQGDSGGRPARSEAARVRPRRRPSSTRAAAAGRSRASRWTRPSIPMGTGGSGPR